MTSRLATDKRRFVRHRYVIRRLEAESDRTFPDMTPRQDIIRQRVGLRRWRSRRYLR